MSAPPGGAVPRRGARRMFTVFVAAGVVVIAVVAGLLAWSANASPAEPRLRVSSAYIPRPASPDVAAAYFTVTNSGDAVDTLTGVRSDVSRQTMMHKEADGLMPMVASVPIPAHHSVVFEPGGFHVMMQQPTRELHEGDHVRLTLTFRHSEPISVDAPVKPLTYRPNG